MASIQQMLRIFEEGMEKGVEVSYHVPAWLCSFASLL